MGRGELVCSSSLTLEQVEEEWLAAQHHLRPRTRQFYRTNYVAYRIGDGPDAEDVTSESFARALRYRESFDGRRATRRMALARRMADRRAVAAGSHAGVDDEVNVFTARELRRQSRMHVLGMAACGCLPPGAPKAAPTPGVNTVGADVPAAAGQRSRVDDRRSRIGSVAARPRSSV